jgi:EAL domain-containing protein (putative c-di-GMP-specific phosphodiesterase class I)/GGDEF domain-containing protein
MLQNAGMNHLFCYHIYQLSRADPLRGMTLAFSIAISTTRSGFTKKKVTDCLLFVNGGGRMELPRDDPVGRHSLEQRMVLAIRRVQKNGGNFALLLIRPRYCQVSQVTSGVVVHPGLVRQIHDRLLTLVRCVDSVVLLNGQNIAILAEDVKGALAARCLARRLHALLDSPFSAMAERGAIDSDMGIALYPLHGLTPPDLIANAKAALLQTTRPGATDMELYNPARSSVGAADRGFSGAELMAAIDHDELVLHYQPQARLPDDSVSGVEALLRWQHPRYGLLYPQQFFPSARLHGVLLSLETWVLRHACMNFASWPPQVTDGMYLGVNVSPAFLCDATFPLLLDAVIAESALLPCRIRLEINADELVLQPAEWVSRMPTVRRRGVGIVLDHVDDLALVPKLLRMLKPGIVKLDMDIFIGEDLAFVHGIIADLNEWAKKYGARLMAQNVEQVSQLAYVLDSGIGEGQGTLFYPPLPAVAVSALHNQ